MDEQLGDWGAQLWPESGEVGPTRFVKRHIELETNVGGGHISGDVHRLGIAAKQWCKARGKRKKGQVGRTQKTGLHLHVDGGDDAGVDVGRVEMVFQRRRHQQLPTAGHGALCVGADSERERAVRR